MHKIALYIQGLSLYVVLMINDDYCNCGIPRQKHDGTCSRCKRAIPIDRLKVEDTDGHFSSSEDFAPSPRNSSDIAINSARIVNGYGLFIQVVGSILAVLILILGLGQPGVYPKSSMVMLISIASAVGMLLGYLVLGAFFRMISNYVIAKLEK
jgi:hypothetical protein